MISDAMDFLHKEIKQQLGLADAESSIGHAHEIKDNPGLGLRISLVNITQETSLRNSPHISRDSLTPSYQEPPLFLNLHILFSFNFGLYKTSLLRLSQTAEYFQSIPLFNRDNQKPGNPLPAMFDKLILDLESNDLEQLNQLWGTLGSCYFPSLLYKVRLIELQADIARDADLVKAINLDMGITR